MKSFRVEPFCKKHTINTGCYDGFRVCRRKNTERKRKLYLYKTQFCLIWKSQLVSFNKAIEESKTNFKVVDDALSDKTLLKVLIIMKLNPKKFLLS